MLRDAVQGRSLNDARSPAQVLHHRITTTLHGRLTPEITSASDLGPRRGQEVLVHIDDHDYLRTALPAADPTGT